ncbi:hypothetical protein CHS0354_034662 [Potamilus streckersoni]|uniref:Uncharacterized protein n=1 Tax=Potamilus streckersoni TaxID=2493646 RepID=A0AAE0TC24_9BIVA|nr:hypothetical protein CHS0354_034662 [Potamilus streckersoni]
MTVVMNYVISFFISIFIFMLGGLLEGELNVLKPAILVRALAVTSCIQVCIHYSCIDFVIKSEFVLFAVTYCVVVSRFTLFFLCTSSLESVLSGFALFLHALTDLALCLLPL